MKNIPRNVRYRGAVYTLQRYTYDNVRERGGVEIGDAYDPQGKVYPGWADIDGRKFAELDGYFMLIDDLDGWRWKWMEGEDQDSVATVLGNEKFLPK